jgi:hypothetical protein
VVKYHNKINREPLNKSGRIKLRVRVTKIKAKIRGNNRGIPGVSNADIDNSGFKLIRHDLFRGTLSKIDE